MLPLELLAAPAGGRLDRYVLDADSFTVVLEFTTPTAACPLCGTTARRVHRRYQRCLADLPCMGRSVQLQVAVRRFLGPQAQCPRRIFGERLGGLARPYARTTDRLRQAHCAIGCALGGEAGARLTICLTMKTSPDTLLRRVKQREANAEQTPRFVGIDDWAWRKGQCYGTSIVDLETSKVVDLLPDRDAETVKAWLKARPGVELVTRHRSGAYGHAISEAAPQAEQVVDRWHLLKNLREAIERLFERQSTAVVTALKSAESVAQPASDSTPDQTSEERSTNEASLVQPPEEPGQESPRLQAQRASRQRRVERFEQVHERHRQKHSVRRIACDLGMSRNAVRRYLRCETCPDWNPGRSRRSRLDKHRAWIDAQLAEGEPNAIELHRRLQGMGFQGSHGSVQRYITKRLKATGKKRTRVNAAKARPVPLPSAKQLSFAWVRRSEDRKPTEQTHLNAIRAGSSELAAALELADEFALLIRKQTEKSLSDWLARAEASPTSEMSRFAEGIRREEAAVLAAVTGPWSNGPVEGHVNRLKTIKRQMFGRAGFVLLRARIVNAA